jgi:hypothetical protein
MERSLDSGQGSHRDFFSKREGDNKERSCYEETDHIRCIVLRTGHYCV